MWIWQEARGWGGYRHRAKPTTFILPNEHTVTLCLLIIYAYLHRVLSSAWIKGTSFYREPQLMQTHMVDQGTEKKKVTVKCSVLNRVPYHPKAQGIPQRNGQNMEARR